VKLKNAIHYLLESIVHDSPGAGGSVSTWRTGSIGSGEA